jgi:pyruvate/2-oxoglutarate dehydrogenase complex dihydrolipoamide acyltransferase (E2) component
MTGSSTDVQLLHKSFESFKEALQGLLTEEARRSVDDAVERLSGEIGTFQLDDVTVEVVINDLKLSTVNGAGPAKPAPRPTAARRSSPAAKTKPSPRRPSTVPAKRGRPVGGVRLAIQAAFDHAGSELSTDGVRDALKAAGVTTSSDNLHQQLRRLVQAGNLTRTGRGQYVRVG